MENTTNRTAKKNTRTQMRSARDSEVAPRRRSAAKAAGPGAGDVSTGYMTVRMYNNILGDCFLMCIPVDKRQIHILVDCGVLQGMDGASDKIRDIAQDIAHTTHGHLDVVIVTHEHWDHLSGFHQAQDIFGPTTIDELWLGWTEDAKDPDAARLVARRRKTLGLLLLLDQHFGPGATSEDPDFEEETPARPEKDKVMELLAFAGHDRAAAARASTVEILDALKRKARTVRYLRPGADPIQVPGNAPVQAYVLGPPRDEKLLSRSNPRKGEVYGFWGETGELGAYLAAALQLEKRSDDFQPDERRAFELAMPFESSLCRSLSAMEHSPSAGESVAEAGTSKVDRSQYFAPGDEWRRIDRDWLGAAEQLALKLDSDTNNTSLVLAFTLGEGNQRRVLLFPGDAQVGNWKSWQQYVWPIGTKRDDPSSIDITRLFASTILYKVGHHASHNATLRAEGLELMTHPDLVAMIPVQEEFARKTKQWNMPFPSLLARLQEKTKGRVLRADKSLSDLRKASAERAGKPGELTEAEWNDFFATLSEGRHVPDGVPLYIEYTIKL